MQNEKKKKFAKAILISVSRETKRNCIHKWVSLSFPRMNTQDQQKSDVK